jgi:hypothetical protein
MRGDHDASRSRGDATDSAPIRTHLDEESDQKSGTPGDLQAHLESLGGDPFSVARWVITENPGGLFPARDLDVVRRYFGTDGEGPWTLERIGQQYGITRERVRQIRERTLSALCELLEGAGRIGQKRMRGDATLVARVREICAPLDQGRFVPAGLWLTPPTAESHPFFLADEATQKAWVEVTLSALGYRKLRVDPIGAVPGVTVWYRRGKWGPKRLLNLLRELRYALLEATDWTPLHRPLSILARVGMEAMPGWNPAEILVSLVPLESRADGFVRVRLPYLRSAGLQARRVLLDRGSPAPAEWIHDRINEALDLGGFAPLEPSVTVLRGAMLRTDGLRPISRSGWWMCSEWAHVSHEPLSDLMVRVIDGEGGAVPVQRLIEGVRAIRPWTPESSILNYISSKRDLFGRRPNGMIVRLGPGKLKEPTHLEGVETIEGAEGMTEGSDLPSHSRDDASSVPQLSSVRGRFRRAVHAFVRRNGSGPHLRDEVVEVLARRAGLPTETVFRRIQRASWTTIEGFGTRARVRFLAGAIPPPRVSGEGGEVIQRLAPVIRGYLTERDDKRETVSALRAHLETEYGALRDHVYRTLKSMPDLIRESDAGRLWVRLDEGGGGVPDSQGGGPPGWER